MRHLASILCVALSIVLLGASGCRTNTEACSPTAASQAQQQDTQAAQDGPAQSQGTERQTAEDDPIQTQSVPQQTTESETTRTQAAPETEGAGKMSEYKVRITAADTTLEATLEDNPTTRDLMARMPMTLSMDNLYSREMCYRFGADALPVGNLISDTYTVGDIAYWPPLGSLVILYAQNGEELERQQVGHISGDLSVFRRVGTVDVTFEPEG